MPSKFVIVIPFEGGAPPEHFQIEGHDWDSLPILFRNGAAAQGRVAIVRQPADSSERAALKAQLLPFCANADFVGIAHHHTPNMEELIPMSSLKRMARDYSREPKSDRVYPHFMAAAAAQTDSDLEAAIGQLSLHLTPQVHSLALELLLLRLPDYLRGRGRDGELSLDDENRIRISLKLARPNEKAHEIEDLLELINDAFTAVGRSNDPAETRQAYRTLKEGLLEILP